MKNDDGALLREASRVLEERKDSGLEGLVGGLECVIINTQPERFEASALELLSTTGHEISDAFDDSDSRSIVLSRKDSADLIVRARTAGENPFAAINIHPRSKSMPDTRLETFVFEVHDLARFTEIQRKRGVRFLTENARESRDYAFIQTAPSRFTGNSIGYIEWKGKGRSYASAGSRPLSVGLAKPAWSHLGNIMELDHTATRVTAEDRDPAILEFMELTNYCFDFAIYVESLNSITNVARHPDHGFAMVFTSGISPYVNDDASGPTEKFTHNYGARVHHMAFRTEKIEDTFTALAAHGMEFLVELVGSPDEGLKQTFSQPSRNTILVNEYIHRYGDFKGFFTKSNVTSLTAATAMQD